MTTIPITELQEVVADIFVASGLSRAASNQVAEALVEAEARGTASHGVALVSMYVDRLIAGSASLVTQPTVVSDRGAVVVLDAQHGLGVPAGDAAAQWAIAKAKTFGIGAASVRNAFHFGAAFRYARAAMQDGLIGIALANTRPLMPAPGGTTAVVGNNPVAIGVPGPHPLLIDMAMSEAALGKIRHAAREGTPIPSTWAVDPRGEPTTDPELALAGLLLPTGGAKGFGLALVIDVLTGVLSGGGFGSTVRGIYEDNTVPNNCSFLLLALDPAFWGLNGHFNERVRTLAEEVYASTTVGHEAVRLPGERADRAARRAAEQGIALSPSAAKSLTATAARVGL